MKELEGILFSKKAVKQKFNQTKWELFPRPYKLYTNIKKDWSREKRSGLENEGFSWELQDICFSLKKNQMPSK